MTLSSFSARHFSSLPELLDWLREHYNLEDDAGRRFTSRKGDLRSNRYLFRGEPGAFAETLPSAQRLYTRLLETQRGDDFRPILQRCGKLIEGMVRKWHTLSIRHSHMYLQHYGLPSDGIDFSANLAVAAAFAETQSSPVGAICVLDTEQKSLHGDDYFWLGNVSLHYDLPEIEASRPMRQEAVFVFLQADSDMKFERDFQKWYTLDQQRTPLAPAKFIDSLYFDLNDNFARFLCDQMNALSPLPETVANWFAERIGGNVLLEELTNEGIAFDVSKNFWEHNPILARLNDQKQRYAARWSDVPSKKFDGNRVRSVNIALAPLNSVAFAATDKFGASLQAECSRLNILTSIIRMPLHQVDWQWGALQEVMQGSNQNILIELGDAAYGSPFFDDVVMPAFDRLRAIFCPRLTIGISDHEVIGASMDSIAKGVAHQIDEILN